VTRPPSNPRPARTLWPTIAALLAAVTAASCSSGPGGASEIRIESARIDYVIPPSAVAGTPGLVLTIGGSSFSPLSTASWNGSPLRTTYVSPTELHARIDAALMAQPGTNQVSVSSARTGAVFVVTNPDPTIGSLSPATAVVGSPGFLLRATGLNFVPGSQLAWNGEALQTTFISRNELSAEIDPRALSAQRHVFVWVKNPDGATSGGALFTVLDPVPRLSALNPGSAISGSGDLPLEVAGSGFRPESQVVWNGSLRPTVFVSESLLRATLSAADLAASAEIAVAVMNPPPGGGSSATLQFTIANPAPSIVAFGPEHAVAGGPGFTLTVTGSGFRPTTVLLWNGVARPTSTSSDGVLHARIAAGDIAAQGSSVVAVFNPPLGGGLATAALAFTAGPVSPPRPQAVTYHQDPARSGRVTFGQSLTFPTSSSWSLDLGSSVSYPLIADGKVFVLTAGTSAGGVGAQLHGFDLGSGAALWDPIDIPNVFSSWAGHAYDAGQVFVVNMDGVLRSFDGATGALRWATPLSSASPDLFDSAPAVLDGTVYVGAAGRMFAVDAASGATRWMTTFPGSEAPFAVVADGVYVSYACEERKLDLLTGSLVWGHMRCSGGGGHVPAYADGLAYVRDIGNGQATIYDASSGEKIGLFASGDTASIPALSPEALFVVDGGRLRSHDLRGQGTNWDAGFLDALASEPIVIDGAAIAVSADGTVHAVDAASGSEIWTASAGAPIYVPFFGDSSKPLPGIAAGEGYLLVPAGNLLTAWRLTPP
jgi:outer membrane protein assembly factor BamB